jgi:hypothetical protein|tara:strand:+ start:370 stop:531 length:162 start_codon:yes stop_codon:yes gene_type:complete
MNKQKRVWDKNTGQLVYVDSVKDFLAQQSEALVEKEEEVVEEKVVEEADEASD